VSLACSGLVAYPPAAARSRRAEFPAPIQPDRCSRQPDDSIYQRGGLMLGFLGERVTLPDGTVIRGLGALGAPGNKRSGEYSVHAQSHDLEQCRGKIVSARMCIRNGVTRKRLVHDR